MNKGREIDEKDLEYATGGAGGAQSEWLYRCRGCQFEKRFKPMIGAKWVCPNCGQTMERVKE